MLTQKNLYASILFQVLAALRIFSPEVATASSAAAWTFFRQIDLLCPIWDIFLIFPFKHS